jgi:hypothetical protein
MADIFCSFFLLSIVSYLSSANLPMPCANSTFYARPEVAVHPSSVPKCNNVGPVCITTVQTR